MTIVERIQEERRRQDEQWGGPEHDDKHTPLDWMGYISEQLEKFGKATLIRGDAYYLTPDCEQRFVKVAALAKAALESFERKRGHHAL